MAILIGYSPDTSTRFCVWATQTKQVIIVSEPFIYESEQGAKILSQWPVKSKLLKRKVPPRKLRPRERPKKVCTETIETTAPANPIVAALIAITLATTENSLAEPAPPAAPLLQEQVILISESNSIIKEPKIYEETVNNPIHGHRWREAIEDKSQNLENHQTWEYDKLPSD